jgi:hypothetical protein
MAAKEGKHLMARLKTPDLRGKPTYPPDDKMRVKFTAVDCGHRVVDWVTVLPEKDATGRVIITEIGCSQEITTTLLRELPLDAMRKYAARLYVQFDRQSRDFPSDRLIALRDSARDNPLFLSAVADTFREAREQRSSGTAAVAEAVGVSVKQAERLISAARRAGHDTGTASNAPKAKGSRPQGNRKGVK